ncbi:MAG: class I SAM-dependent methyltransferase, partial [Vicinamibacteria bacterium]
MTKPASDTSFTDDVARFYESNLVPLIFRPYADDLAARTMALRPRSVLEVACGTGVVTRALAEALPSDVAIVATDLNQAMVAQGQKVGTRQSVTWRQADVMNLPYAAGSFDVAVCQFGTMFFPDRAAAYREVRRVLRPGGTFLFNVWNGIE